MKGRIYHRHVGKALYYALKKMKKKLDYRERNREERTNYYKTLRELIKLYSSQAIVYIDEVGFEVIQPCIYA